jgi:hypothetical protein
MRSTIRLLMPERPFERLQSCSRRAGRCKWSKREIDDNTKELAKLIHPPKFVCLKCARSAKHKANLCKPLSIKRI